MHKPVYVTQPAMPSLDEYIPYLNQIWENKILTNNGPFHKQFEKELAEYLGVKYISVFSNGTLALLTALQALKIKGEVITTPFSFVATTHSLWWNGITPVFADIESEYMNLDPDKAEAAITPGTTAIMPVHVYGNPCNLDRFTQIAEKYGLKLLYDAAHAFGVKKEGISVLNHGDLSVLSFHATKVFNTFEGGAIISHNERMKHHIDNLKNFGFRGETIVEEPGINAKMNELQAAFGLLQLKYIDENISKRKEITDIYHDMIDGIRGISTIKDMQGVEHTYTYFPILIDPVKYGKSRDSVYEEFKWHNIYTRRYFYPLISRFLPYRNLPSSNPELLPVAEKISEKVLCLPLFPDLDESTINTICSILRKK